MSTEVGTRWAEFLALTPGEQLDRVMASMDRIVRAAPEGYRYHDTPGNPGVGMSCRYVHTVDGTQVPGCIVGQVLTDLGMPLALLESNGTVPYRANGWGIAWPAAAALAAAQGAQDEQSTWKQAYEAANAVRSVLFGMLVLTDD